MKVKIFLPVFFVVTFFVTHAQQVPNNSFESWTTNPYAPNNWSTFESAFGAPLGLSKKDTADKFIGTASISLTSDSVPGFPQLGVQFAVAALGTIDVSQGTPLFYGIPFPYRPDTLYFGFKYVPVGNDTALLALGFKSNGAYMLGNTQVPASLLLESNPQWILGNVAFSSYFLNTNTPDTLEIQLYSSLPTPGHIPGKGSKLGLDGIFFGYVNLPVALQEVADRLNISVYPNPANDMITISMDDNADGFRAVISDMNGKIVAVSNLGTQKTQISVAEFSSGTYIYLVADKQGNIIKRERFSIVK